MDTNTPKLKILAFTRGFDVDYEWKCSWESASSKTSDSNSRNELKNYGLMNQVRGEQPGLLISRVNDAFALLVCGISTDYRASRAGEITASFAFLDLSEGDVQRLAVGILENWKIETGRLIETIQRHSPPKADPEWSFDIPEIVEFAQSFFESKASEVIPRSSERKSRPYTVASEECFAGLAELVRTLKLSAEKGVKVAIGKPSSSTSEQGMLDEADFLVFPNCQYNNHLPDKKKGPGEPIPPTTTSTQSESPSKKPSTSVQSVLSPGNTQTSMSPGTGFNNIWKILVVGVIGGALLILMYRCGSKPIPEPPPKKKDNATSARAQQVISSILSTPSESPPSSSVGNRSQPDTSRP